jgi:hypothetical protein
MQRDTLINKALSGFGNVGDVFTDSWDTKHRVAAAENLRVLGSMLSHVATEACAGTLFSGDKVAGPATVDIDGTVSWEVPEGFDTSGSVWSLMLPNGVRVRVEMFVVGEASDDERWVITDPEKFYAALLS